MYPVLFKIFGLQMHAFGFMVSLGFLGGLFALNLIGPGRGLSNRNIPWLAFGLLFFGIAGARLLFVLVHWNYFITHPFEILMAWKGGYVLYGSLLGAGAFAVLYAGKQRIPMGRLADILLPVAMLGLAIGRIGCLLVGDCYGKRAPENLPWAIAFPYHEGCMIPEDLLYLPLHPTQIYHSLNALFIFFLAMYILRHRRFEGQVFLVGVALYGVNRFLIEFFRGDDAARGFLGPLSTSQWISLCVVFVLPLLYAGFRRQATEGGKPVDKLKAEE